MSLRSANRFAHACPRRLKLPCKIASADMSWTCSACSSPYASLGHGPFSPGSTLQILS